MGRLLPFIVVILVLVGLMVAVPMFLLQPERYHAEITNALSQKLRHTVVIGKMDARFFPPVLRLHEVTVFKSADTPLLQADEVDAVPDGSGLLHLRFLPSLLTVIHPVLWGHRQPNGAWDWDEWLMPASELSGKTGWPLHSVAVQDGECHALDTVTSQEIALNHINGTLNEDQQAMTFSGTTTGLAAPITLTFEGKGHFGRSPQWSGDARLADEDRQWNIHLDDQNGNLEARGQSALWRWDPFYSLIKFYGRLPGSATPAGSLPLMMQDWKTHFTVDSGSVTFYHAASIGGGLSEVKGGISPSGNTLRLHGEGAFQDVPMSFFASSGFESLSSVDGKLTGIARFELVLSTQPWSGFEGQGSVEIKDGLYTFPQSSLKSLSRAHTASYLKKKFPGFEAKGLPFKRFRVHWLAKDGFVTFDDALLDAGDVKAALAGRLDGSRQGIDSYIRLQIHEKSLALIKEIPGHYLYGPPGHEQIQPIYGHLQGTWNEWSLRAASSSKVPARIQSKLRTSLTTP